MKTRKRKIGDIGEEIATKFLVKHCFRVIQRNYLKKWGEIDIVCEKYNKLHFIEVKTVSRQTLDSAHSIVRGKTGIDEYRPEDNIHPTKLARLRRVISSYLAEYGPDRDFEFHAILVELNSEAKKASVRMLKNLII